MTGKNGTECHLIASLPPWKLFVLQPLSVFTNALSGESQVTVSAIRPLLKHITTSLLSVSTSDCMLIKDMKETITDSLGSHYICQEVSELIDKCSFLDPRFKSNALRDNASTIAQLKAEAKEIVGKPRWCC